MNKYTKVCKDCKQEKPLEDYYSRKGINKRIYQSYCKPCHSKRNAKYTKKGNKPPQHEVDIVNYLLAHGYPALHGRDFRIYPNVDIVIYGCIRVEAKSLKLALRDNEEWAESWFATNSAKQQRNGWSAEILCLELDRELYFFDAKNPLFYGVDGKLKTSVSFTPDSLRMYNAEYEQITWDNMRAAHNNTQLIDLAFDKWRLKQSCLDTSTSSY